MIVPLLPCRLRSFLLAARRTPSRRALRGRPLSLAAGCALLALLAAPPHASAFGYEAARLGSFLGAMRHCEERYGENERRYRRARLNAARELEDMERHERLRALRARDRAFERGEFMRNRLDREECRGLLRASEWRRLAGD